MRDDPDTRTQGPQNNHDKYVKGSRGKGIEHAWTDGKFQQRGGNYEREN